MIPVKIKIDHLNVAYDQAGRGMPLLLIHGYPLNRTVWESQYTDLRDIAHLIIPDLRGYGESDAELWSENELPLYTMEQLADDCIGLLDRLNITEPVVVGGLSMGGYVAFAFYRKYPARVAGLILAATRAGEDTPEGKANRDRAVELAKQSGSSAIAESMLPKMLSPKTFSSNLELVSRVLEMMQSASLSGIIGALRGMKTRQDSTPLLQQIDIPVLILHGADDQIIPLSESQAMAASIPNARLEIIPEAGHLIPLEQPELTNASIRKFLSILQKRGD